MKPARQLCPPRARRTVRPGTLSSGLIALSARGAGETIYK